MPTLPDDFDLDNCDSCKEGPFADSDIAFVEVRDIMQSVHFVNAFKTIFLNHG